MCVIWIFSETLWMMFHCWWCAHPAGSLCCAYLIWKKGIMLFAFWANCGCWDGHREQHPVFIKLRVSPTSNESFLRSNHSYSLDWIPVTLIFFFLYHFVTFLHWSHGKLSSLSCQTSISQIYFNWATPKIIFHVSRNFNQWKRDTTKAVGREQKFLKYCQLPDKNSGDISWDFF